MGRGVRLLKHMSRASVPLLTLLPASVESAASGGGGFWGGGDHCVWGL